MRATEATMEAVDNPSKIQIYWMLYRLLKATKVSIRRDEEVKRLNKINENLRKQIEKLKRRKSTRIKHLGPCSRCRQPRTQPNYLTCEACRIKVAQYKARKKMKTI